MSGKAFALWFTPFFALGLVGVWLFGGHQHSGIRFAAGLCLTLGAIAGLLITFRRDLWTPEAEKRAEWAKARARGRRNYVMREVLKALTCLLVTVATIIGGQLAWGLPKEAVWSTARMYGSIAAITAPLAILHSLWLWRRQEKKYAGVV